MCHQTGLVLVDLACCVLFDLEYPLAAHNVGVIGTFDNIPGMGILQTF